MKEEFEKIWELAFPYQDKRDDPGHAEVTLRFARYLVELEKGDEDIVIPSIIMHDIGYSQLTKERRLQVFNKDLKDEERKVVQMEHQNESVKLAAKILREVNYSEDMTKEILEIISQHDTREGFISKNEGLVRDADKLWRTSKEGAAAAEGRRKAEEAKPKVVGQMGDETKPRPEKKRDDKSPFQKTRETILKAGYFYSEIARQMALADLKGLKMAKPEKGGEPT